MKISEYFLSSYEDSEFILKQKSHTLFYLNIILTLVLPTLLLTLNILTERPLVSLLNIMLVSMTSGMLLSLFFLKQGMYTIAANATVLFAIFSFTLYSFFGKMQFDNGVVWGIYHLIIFIVFASLFSGRRLTTVVFIIAIAVGYTSTLYRDILPMDEARVMLANFTFVALIIYVISYQLLSINTKTLVKLKEEADNREQYERIKNLLNSIKEISFELSSASGEMADVSSSFSTNAQHQAASAEEITATVEEISAGVENVADSAKYQLDRMNLLMDTINQLSESIKNLDVDVDETTSLADQVSHEARTGENVMKEMTESMNNIGSSSTQMSGIVSIINDISDRINLLSLNASIEAARAGDAGRGFAVVADEISKLADQTSESVKEIDSLIKKTGGYISSGMTSVQATVKTISSIIEGITEISDKINKVIHSSMLEQLETNKKVNDESITVKSRSDEIFGAATEQKHAANEIVKSISVINELTQANATGSEQIAGNSQLIADLSEKLKERVESFEAG